MTLSDFRDAYRTHVRKHIVEFLDTLTIEDFNQPAILVSYTDIGPLLIPSGLTVAAAISAGCKVIFFEDGRCLDLINLTRTVHPYSVQQPAILVRQGQESSLEYPGRPRTVLSS